MSIESYVVSLPLSKRLKELNVPQKSLFAWFKPKHVDEWELCQSGSTADTSDWTSENHISAFIASELGEMLPSRFKAENGDFGSGYLSLYKDESDSWTCCYDGALEGKFFTEKTSADAYAEMLIHLLEQKSITLPV